MTKYDDAVAETQSVLAEWLVPFATGTGGTWHVDLGAAIVDRLVAKGIIQSTDPEELGYRTGPLEPGRRIVGGDHAQRVAEARDWTLTEHAETLRRLGDTK